MVPVNETLLPTALGRDQILGNVGITQGAPRAFHLDLLDGVVGRRRRDGDRQGHFASDQESLAIDICCHVVLPFQILPGPEGSTMTSGPGIPAAFI